MPRERAPRANHKYKDRKRVDGRWVYDYGKGFVGLKGSAAAEPPKALTRDDVGAAMVAPGMADIRAARAAMGANPDQRRLRMLAAIAAARIRPDKPVVTTDDDLPNLDGGLANLFPASGPTVQSKRQSADLNPEATIKPTTTGAIKPPGSKEELMRQVSGISKWSKATLAKDVAKFCQETGFKMVADETAKRPGPNRVAATKGAAINLLALRHLVNVVPEMTNMLNINVIASGKNASATYSSGQQFKSSIFGLIREEPQNKITVHDKDSGHSVVHEFGHFLDHFLGDPKRIRGFASEDPSSPMASFVKQMRGTDSYKAWDSQVRNTIKVRGQPDRSSWSPGVTAKVIRHETKHINYLKSSKEMVARFFDCWAHWKLKKKGYDVSLLGTAPDYTSGAFSDKDIEALAPMFENALGERLKKGFLSALRDLRWLAKHRPS